MVLRITIPLTRQGRAAPDVRWTKVALNRLGFYMPDRSRGIDENEDEQDEDFEDALHAFRRKAAIALDETDIGPDSVTRRILKRDLAAQDFNGVYIWRTVGDDHVRGEHATRAGQRFVWSTPPKGGHPGEDYNCRCWAEPVAAPYHPWIEWAREQKENRALLKSPYVEANASALFFEGAVISVGLCLRNGRCRAWLMNEAKEFILKNTYHLPPKTLPAFPDAKKDKERNGRKRWVDSQGKIYEWDYQHGEVERYDKTGKKHEGGFDPVTGKQRSPEDKTKKAKK